MTDQDPTTQLKALTREHLRLVWQAAQLGGEQLNDDDRRTAEAMAEHSEYAHLWDRLDRLSDYMLARITSIPALFRSSRQLAGSASSAINLCATVSLVTRTYATGGKLTNKAMQVCTQAIERLPTLERWFVTLRPSPV
jgi:hypothetical protein